jgi:hypothetical protein
VLAASIIALMMEAASSSETSVNSYQTTQRDNPKESHLHTRSRENLKSHFTRISSLAASFMTKRSHNINTKRLKKQFLGVYKWHQRRTPYGPVDVCLAPFSLGTSQGPGIPQQAKRTRVCTTRLPPQFFFPAGHFPPGLCSRGLE